MLPKERNNSKCMINLSKAAWLSGQSWGFEYGKPGFKFPTWTTEWIWPR